MPELTCTSSRGCGRHSEIRAQAFSAVLDQVSYDLCDCVTVEFVVTESSTGSRKRFREMIVAHGGGHSRGLPCWRIPHQRNCRPSALEVILPFHYHATSHVPARSSHSRPRCPSASCACTSAMHQRNRPGGCGGRNRPDSNPSSRGKLVGAPVQRSDVRIPMMCKIISAPNLGNWVFFKP